MTCLGGLTFYKNFLLLEKLPDHQTNNNTSNTSLLRRLKGNMATVIEKENTPSIITATAPAGVGVGGTAAAAAAAVTYVCLARKAGYHHRVPFFAREHPTRKGTFMFYPAKCSPINGMDDCDFVDNDEGEPVPECLATPADEMLYSRFMTITFAVGKYFSIPRDRRDALGVTSTVGAVVAVYDETAGPYVSCIPWKTYVKVAMKEEAAEFAEMQAHIKTVYAWANEDACQRVLRKHMEHAGVDCTTKQRRELLKVWRAMASKTTLECGCGFH